ncbi:transglutaminase family protein [Thiolapillus sp.]
MKDLLVFRPLSLPLFRLGILLILLAALPHAWNLHPGISAAFLLFMLLRLIFWPRPESPAPSWLMVLLLGTSVALVILQADMTRGRQFGVALLVLMAGMKLLEMKTRRDLYVLVFLGYFVLVTLFLFYQSPLMTTYVLLVSTGLAALLIGNNLSGSHLPLKLVGGKALVMMASSIPVMVLLFILFPRLDGPLWSISMGAGNATTGISDNIRMGSISRLSQSREVAFRVRFMGNIPPPSQRYWRGMVLWHTDGMNWTRGESRVPGRPFQGESPTITYEVTMEPSHQPWLFPLDHVLKPAEGLVMTSDGELATPQPIKQRFTWKGESAIRVRGTDLDNREWELGLQLPQNISLRTQQFAASLRQDGDSDEDVIQAALRYFRQEAFVYTLSPPPLGPDPVDAFLFESRKGFCEHYATSFVILMRLSDIPARVVVGYQGGEANPLGGHLVVRQSEAHAWAEVWLENRGWVRIDPTSAVAPERIEHPIAATDYPDGSPVTFDLGRSPDFISGLLHNIRWFQDNLQLKWHYWVVGFDSQRQQSLLHQLGVPELSGYGMGLAAVMGAMLLGSLLFLLGTWQRRTSADPLYRSYERFRKKLKKGGLAVPPAIGPEDLGRLAMGKFPHRAGDIQAIVRQYIELRYGASAAQENLSEFHARVRRFRC